MCPEIIDETLLQRWINFFEGNFKAELETLATRYPDERSIVIDYWDFDRMNPDLLREFIERPRVHLHHAETALSKIDTVIGKMGDITIHLKNMPDILPLKCIREKHLYKFIQIQGIAKRVTDISPMVTVATFMCRKCHSTTRILQVTRKLVEPDFCESCDRTSSFDRVYSQDEYIDVQRAEIHDTFQGMNSLSIFLEKDLAGAINIGDEVMATGILLQYEKKIQGEVSTTLGKDFKVNHIEKKSNKNTELTDVDVKKITEMTKDPMYINKMLYSIAPSIYGLVMEKKGCLLQLLGGAHITNKDGTTRRGNIHILLVGDPSTGKSHLSTFIEKIAPRVVVCEGKGTTSAGLTATAVKDEHGIWTYDAGAMVLANNGLLIVDEFDKMPPEERNALNKGLEQGSISLTKAGMNIQLPANCSLLAISNPKLGRFDQFTPLLAQMEIPEALFTRFDLIFPVLDVTDKEQDAEIANSILEEESGKPIYTAEEISKFIIYAQRIQPRLDKDAIKLLKEYHVQERAIGNKFTPRNLEGLRRLTIAHAKLRLSAIATVVDAEEIIKLAKYAFTFLMDPTTGQTEWGQLNTGMTEAQLDRVQNLMHIIRAIAQKTKDNTASFEEIWEQMQQFNVPLEKLEVDIEKLRERGAIMQPNSNIKKYRMM